MAYARRSRSPRRTASAPRRSRAYVGRRAGYTSLRGKSSRQSVRRARTGGGGQMKIVLEIAQPNTMARPELPQQVEAAKRKAKF